MRRIVLGWAACVAGVALALVAGFRAPGLGAGAVLIAALGVLTTIQRIPRLEALVLALVNAGAAAWIALAVHEDLRGERRDTGPDPLVERTDPRVEGAKEAWLLQAGDDLLFRATGPEPEVRLRPGASGEVRIENRAAPADRGAPEPSDAVRIAVWGDCRGGVTVFERLCAEIARRRPDFSVGLGDLVGMARTYQFEILKDRLAASGAPAFVVPGNHDLDPFGTLRPFARALGPPRWWFRWRGALFLGLDTSKGTLDPQDVSLAESLVRARPAGEPVLLFLHHPLWMPFDRDEKPLPPDDPATRRLQALVEEEGVHVFASHWHGYDERTVGRATQVTTGGAGARLESGDAYHYVWVEVRGGQVRTEKVDLLRREEVSATVDRLKTLRDEGSFATGSHTVVMALGFLSLSTALAAAAAVVLPRRARAP